MRLSDRWNSSGRLCACAIAIVLAVLPGKTAHALVQVSTRIRVSHRLTYEPMVVRMRQLDNAYRSDGQTL